jgi:hypothetical protein
MDGGIGMSSDNERQERLVNLLDEYTKKADADYATAARIFDTRWPNEEADLQVIYKTIGNMPAPKVEVRVIEKSDLQEQRASEERHRRAYLRCAADLVEVSVELAAMTDQTGQRVPPKIAEFCLALFLSKARGEAMIGDLSERFEQDCQQFGPERARRLYWGRALRSLWPLLRRTFARAIKWGVVVESMRRFF